MAIAQVTDIGRLSNIWVLRYFQWVKGNTLYSPEGSRKLAGGVNHRFPIDSGSAPAGSGGIRVDQEKLDRLIQSAGELLVARNAFPVLAKKLALEHGLSGMGKEVKDAGDHISRIAEDLQAAVMSIRMMPIRTVFQRFPRMVRDICRAQDKEVELLLEGEDTELDKTVIEQIADPLVHLVRNAADHGIELPDVRVQGDKPRVGKVTLKAYNKANNVVIEVHDDGRGMDPRGSKRKRWRKDLSLPALLRRWMIAPR
jgi:two-component system chemotaxis sensor kinase CheA